MANINIGGGVRHFNAFSLFYIKNNDILSKHNISIFDGLNDCHWNGGKINKGSFIKEHHLKFFDKYHINVSLTFTNPVIDLEDPVGNELLEMFHKEGNSIILVNERLREYIRKKYPLYKLIFSITGFGDITGKLTVDDISIYKGLEDKYDLIVPRNEHIWDPGFDLLNIEKYEIMINNTCLNYCPKWVKHFGLVGMCNRTDKLIDDYKCIIPKYDQDDPSITQELIKPEVAILKELGYNSWKIVGREESEEDYKNVLNGTLIEMIGEL